jgi:hypothetical protein
MVGEITRFNESERIFVPKWDVRGETGKHKVLSGAVGVETVWCIMQHLRSCRPVCSSVPGNSSPLGSQIKFADIHPQKLNLQILYTGGTVRIKVWHATLKSCASGRVLSAVSAASKTQSQTSNGRFGASWIEINEWSIKRSNKQYLDHGKCGVCRLVLSRPGLQFVPLSAFAWPVLLWTCYTWYILR